MLAPLIWYLFSFRKFTDCTKLGYFVLVMPLMGLALLICYIWGRYYAAKLDYARTVRNFLDDTDTVTDTISYEESKESKRFSPKSKNSLPYMSLSTESKCSAARLPLLGSATKFAVACLIGNQISDHSALFIACSRSFYHNFQQTPSL